MKNFAKSVLNYFAAYNETRFRFNRKLPYYWTEDSFTLDLSVFPEFQNKLVEAVASGNQPSFEIEKGQYTVALDHDGFLVALKPVLAEQFNQDFLHNLVSENFERLQEASPEEEGEHLQSRAFAEGGREYNLAFRKRLLQLITEAQDQKIKELQNEFGFHSVPPSSFNPQREVQSLYDDLQKIAAEHETVESYVSAVFEHVTSQFFGYVIFDLHPVLRSYLQLTGIQPIYVFFHAIEKDSRHHPLFAVEIAVQDGEERIMIETPRDVVMLNTPGINSFEFDTVLTTPRACRFNDPLLRDFCRQNTLSRKASCSPLPSGRW